MKHVGEDVAWAFCRRGLNSLPLGTAPEKGEYLHPKAKCQHSLPGTRGARRGFCSITRGREGLAASRGDHPSGGHRDVGCSGMSILQRNPQTGFPEASRSAAGDERGRRWSPPPKAMPRDELPHWSIAAGERHSRWG